MIFSDDTYTTLHGSLVVSFFILCRREKMPSLHFLKKKLIRFKELTIKGKCPVEDGDIAGLCKYFRLPVDEKPSIVLVESRFNKLFMPYVNIDGENVILPLREDSVYPQTYYKQSNVTEVVWD